MEPLTAGDPPIIGSSRLRARLGSGGMGRVYLGSSPAGRAVAIKVIHPELAHDETFRSRFRREVAAARQVSGAYTAPVVAAGLDGHPLWLATAFVAGPSLAAAVSAQGPFPEASTWRLAAGLAEALGAVHACGLVHRDLKPANVLLAGDGPRLIDFGIARALDGTAITASGHIVGTPAFMSPEQAEGLATGPGSDVFSLGSVLAFAASGTPPFGTDRPAAILYRVVHAEPALTGIPAALRPLIAACLAKRPAARPALADLTGVIAAHWSPSGAGPPGEFWPETLAGLVRSYEAALPPAAGNAGPAVSGAPRSVTYENPPPGTASQPGADGPRNGPLSTAVAMGAEPGPRGERAAGGEDTVTGPRGEPAPRGEGTVPGPSPLAGASAPGEAGPHFQFLRHYSPLSTGVHLLPVATAVAIGSVAGTQAAVRAGTKTVVTGGLLLIAVFYFWAAATISTTLSYGIISIQMVVYGLGLGLTSAPATESIMGAIAARTAGVGSAVNDTTRLVGGTLGVAVIGSVYASLYQHRLGGLLAAGVPGGLVRTSQQSVGAGLAVAQHLTASGQTAQGQVVSVTTTNAFLHGLQVGSVVLAAVALAGAPSPRPPCSPPGRRSPPWPATSSPLSGSRNR